MAILGMLVAMFCMANLPVALAAWPFESGGTVALGYGASYSRDGRTATHSGVDLAAEAGTPVCSPADGEVSFAGRIPGGSGTVLALTVRTSDGLLVTLMPLVSTDLVAGAGITAGDTLGTVAESGDPSSEETHLHVGVRRGETYIDPSIVLGAAPAAPDTDPATEEVPVAVTVPVPETPEPAAPPAPAVTASPGGASVPVNAPGAVADPAPADLSVAGEALDPGAPGAASLPDVAHGTAIGSADVALCSEPAGDPTGASGGLAVRAQAFRESHSMVPSAGAARSVSDTTSAAVVLTAAGLLAMWPLWRRKGHAVPDVRPVLDDVAAAAAR